MAFICKFRAFFGSVVCMSIVLSKLASPAIAQSHSVWVETNETATITPETSCLHQSGCSAPVSSDNGF